VGKTGAPLRLSVDGACSVVNVGAPNGVVLVAYPPVMSQPGATCAAQNLLTHVSKGQDREQIYVTVRLCLPHRSANQRSGVLTRQVWTSHHVFYTKIQRILEKPYQGKTCTCFSNFTLCVPLTV